MAVSKQRRRHERQFEAKGNQGPEIRTIEQERARVLASMRRWLIPLGVVEGDAIWNRVRLMLEESANCNYFRAKRDVLDGQRTLDDYRDFWEQRKQQQAKENRERVGADGFEINEDELERLHNDGN